MGTDQEDTPKEPPLRPYIRALLSPTERPKALRRWGRYLLKWLLFGVLVSAAAAAGSIWQAGFDAAWRLYGRWWVALPVLAVGTPIAGVITIGLINEVTTALVLLVALPLSILFEYVGKKKATALRAAGRWGLLAALLVGAAWLAFRSGSDEAAKDLRPPPRASEAAARELRDVAHRQVVATEELSESASDLLDELDATSAEIERSRRLLRGVLAQGQRQQSRARSAAAQVDDLVMQEQLVRLRSRRLRELLEGEAPMTNTQYLLANRYALPVAFVLGIASSARGPAS
jgi:hypothetical protein